MSERYKVICGCECCISSKIIHSLLLSWRDCYMKNIKDIIQNEQNRRSGEMNNDLFEHIKNLLCCMGVIYMQHHLTRTWLQCVHIHHPNMHFHTGNEFCVVVLIYHVLIFQTKNQICIIPTHLLQYVFIFITSFHVVQRMEDSH